MEFSYLWVYKYPLSATNRLLENPPVVNGWPVAHRDGQRYLYCGTTSKHRPPESLFMAYK